MKIAVVGATGLVGTEMLKVLAERQFPVTELLPVASAKSVGQLVHFQGKDYPVVSMEDAIAARPAVQRGRMVNRAFGAPETQLRERHDASDFETRSADKLAPSP